MSEYIDYQARLIRVLEYIHDHLDGDLSLDALAEVACMSRFHWHRVFRAMQGETLAVATRRIRLNRAACWLVQSDMELSEIARRTGYSSSASFTRAFTDAFGRSPTAFRRRGELLESNGDAKKGEISMYPIEIAPQPQRRLAAVLHRGPYIEVGGAFEKVSAYFSAGQLWSYAQGMVGVYLDGPDSKPESELRSYAGIVVDDSFKLPEGLEEYIIPESRAAVLHYKGPYSGLKQAYLYLYGTWLPQSGEEVRHVPPFEVYLNSPADTKPEDLLTEVNVPLVG